MNVKEGDFGFQKVFIQVSHLVGVRLYPNFVSVNVQYDSLMVVMFNIWD